MNPFGLFIVALGVIGIIIGVKTVSNPLSGIVNTITQPFTSLGNSIGNIVNPPAPKPGGQAPASPGATETYGGHTYKPVKNPHGSGYVWQLVK